MIDKKAFDQLIKKLADILIEKKGSDIIINANANPALIIDNQINHIENIFLSEEDSSFIAKHILNADQWEKLSNKQDVNFMLEYSEHGNFRTNVFYNRGKIGLVLRFVPTIIPSFSELSLPSSFEIFSEIKRGMALFVGVTGVGKSTSLASVIDRRNSKLAEHIITIEDPIEFLHKNKKSIVTQREVGIDVNTYKDAVKSSLRQAPDTLLIGEIRDEDVMKQSILLAETGHMIYATIHADSSIQAIERILNFYPNEKRQEILSDLSHAIKIIITQRLLIKADGKGRIVALEIMENTPYISELIREGKLSDINEAIERNSIGNSITMDDYLFNLYEENKVSYSEVIKYASSQHNLRLKILTTSSKPLPDEITNDGMDEDFTLEKQPTTYRKKYSWSGIN